MHAEAAVSLGLCLSANNKINHDGYNKLLSEMKDLPIGSSRYRYMVAYHLAHKHAEHTKAGIFSSVCFCSRKWLKVKEEKGEMERFSETGKKRGMFCVLTHCNLIISR